ncbi:MAG: hypothetical protein ACLR23_14600 [Clostridia bacterium]
MKTEPCSTLIHYTDPAYAAAHSVITFQTADGLEKYTAFAVVPVQKTDAWYSFIRAADGSEFAKQVALLQSKSLYDTGVTPVYGQQLLTLSTSLRFGKRRQTDCGSGAIVTFIDSTVLLLTKGVKKGYDNPCPLPKSKF